MFGSFFKPKSYYVFNYKPRYYDERKERLQKLEEKYHGNKEADDIPKVTLTKSRLRNEWVKNKRNASDRAITIRLAAIIAILFGIVAYIFKLHTLF